ncbi:hypothetical protein SKAU_G00066340 [Synaphobranchus kaupii]|uniref:Uncharacterized protein n=1 Tax=Synaphobranchus kaupii TaxID=118154 RepID=A0A9Q1G5U6_SYNKA|nr:hypothetical protein SKAU_G00066340 [Synaphobranchus kaupii]
MALSKPVPLDPSEELCLRACPAACGALIAARDTHSLCVMCLGLKHAQEAIDSPKRCSHCLALPKKLRQLRQRVAATHSYNLGPEDSDKEDDSTTASRPLQDLPSPTERHLTCRHPCGLHRPPARTGQGQTPGQNPRRSASSIIQHGRTRPFPSAVLHTDRGAHEPHTSLAGGVCPRVADRILSLRDCRSLFKPGSRVQYRTCRRLQGLMASASVTENEGLYESERAEFDTDPNSAQVA